MSYELVIIPMVRDMIGDNASSIYCDSDLQQKIVTAINLMQLEIDFVVDYVADIIGLTVTPDPSDTPVDINFMALAALKTACMIERAEASRATSQSVVSVSDNDFKIQTGGTSGKDKLQAVQVNWCLAYQQAKNDFIMSMLSGTVGKAVISPFAYYPSWATGGRPNWGSNNRGGY